MRIVVTGGSGVVASSFLSYFNKHDHVIFVPSRLELDVTEKNKIKKYLEIAKPDVILHFAAFRDAGKAELERGNKKGEVWRTNVIGTKNLIKL
jgi:dTDP-4-dehydrorhamnose reductase